MSRWLRRVFKRDSGGEVLDRRLGGPDTSAPGVARAAWTPPPPIEYLVRAKNGNDWDLLLDDITVLVPLSFPTHVVAGTDVFTVRCADWSVECSAEDPGWQLSFAATANQVDAWRYATEVAEQLTTAMRVAAYAEQIAGFDGGIFHCDEAFGIESRNVIQVAVHDLVSPGRAATRMSWTSC